MQERVDVCSTKGARCRPSDACAVLSCGTRSWSRPRGHLGASPAGPAAPWQGSATLPTDGVNRAPLAGVGAAPGMRLSWASLCSASPLLAVQSVCKRKATVTSLAVCEHNLRSRCRLRGRVARAGPEPGAGDAAGRKRPRTRHAFPAGFLERKRRLFPFE